MVPEDVRDCAGQILALSDACCEQLLDVEHRTAARRLLADMIAAEPDILRGRARPTRSAAALMWTVVRMNEAIGRGAPLQVKDLVGWFGERGDVSDRGRGMYRALHPDRPWVGRPETLGRTRYLTSGQRQRLIERRDALRRREALPQRQASQS